MTANNPAPAAPARTHLLFQSVVSRLLLVCVCAACPFQVVGFEGERWSGGASSPLYGALSPYLSVKRITSTVRCPRCPRCQRNMKLHR